MWFGFDYHNMVLVEYNQEHTCPPLECSITSVDDVDKASAEYDAVGLLLIDDAPGEDG